VQTIIQVELLFLKFGFVKATLRGPDRVTLYVTSQRRLDILDDTVLLQNATFVWVAWGWRGGGGRSGSAI
jgi:hypothetical protein